MPTGPPPAPSGRSDAVSTRLAALTAAYTQARRDLAAGLIAQADYDKTEQILDQALDAARTTTGDPK